MKAENEEDPEAHVFNTYTTERTDDDILFNTADLEEMHNNEFQNLKQTEYPELQTLVDDVKNPDDNVAKPEQGAQLYPTGEGTDPGTYYFDRGEKPSFKNAVTGPNGSVNAGLDWIDPFIFNWEWANDGGAISGEDEKFAAARQVIFNRYTDIDTYFWSHDIEILVGDEGTHGMNMAYDGRQDKLIIADTAANPDSNQHHAEVGESNYLNPEHDAYSLNWHPLRFSDYDSSEPVDFETAKLNAAAMFGGITSGGKDEDITESVKPESGTTITTGYLQDITEKLRNYNEDDSDAEFHEIKRQAQVYSSLKEKDDNFIVFGDYENPLYAKVEDESLLHDVWEDEDGTYDNLGEHIDDLQYVEPETALQPESPGDVEAVKQYLGAA